MMHIVTRPEVYWYKNTVKASLGKPHTGGTDERFADEIMPAFSEILELSENPQSILEIGFNCGASALMFLVINPQLKYTSIDLVKNEVSEKFLSDRFKFNFIQMDSADIRTLFVNPGLIFIDGDHSEESARRDITNSIFLGAEYLLIDDVRHPSHTYIWDMIVGEFEEYLEVVKLYEFNHIWEGYSFALCRVKYHD